MSIRDQILQYVNDPKNQPVSMGEVAQLAQTLHAKECGRMMVLLADIREAAGDAEGRLMQPELVGRISDMHELLREFAAFHVSDYAKMSDTAKTYCALRRRARKLGIRA